MSNLESRRIILLALLAKFASSFLAARFCQQAYFDTAILSTYSNYSCQYAHHHQIIDWQGTLNQR